MISDSGYRQGATGITLLIIFLISCCIDHEVKAQASPSLNSAEIKLQVNKLNVLGSVLYIAAHPDDENTRLLTYFSKEKLYRTGYLSLTRGDGGQNLIGNEQGELLGLIRTQELLAARRIDGAEQFFTRANDFGFSKSPEETFSFWNKDSIMSDVVYVIRYFQPDVIICRFPATADAGHGHHTASAMLAAEAFTAAADPSRYPDQLKTVSVWQAKRLLWNVFSSGTNTNSTDQFKFDVDLYNPLLGKGYSEIAAESRTMHKSQGFGATKGRGVIMEYFKTISGTPPDSDLMNGVNTSWKRIPGSDAVQSAANTLVQNYIQERPAESVSQLINVLDAIQNLPDSYWKRQKKKEVEQLLQWCAGLWFEAYATESTISPGNMFEWKVQAINRSNVPILLKSVTMQRFDTVLNKSLSNNELFTLQRKQPLEKNTGLTQPYWLQKPHDIGSFNIPDRQMILKPENDATVTAIFEFEIAGRNFFFNRPVVFKYTDPVKGEVYKPLAISPAVTVHISEPVYIFSSNDQRKISVELKSNIDSAKGFVTLKVSSRWKVSPSSQVFEFKRKGEKSVISFSVAPSSNNNISTSDTVRAVIEMNGQSYHKDELTIAYDHIPTITVYPESYAKLVSVPLQTKGRSVGYISGAGDMVPDILRQIGYSVTMLSETDISISNLQQYDAIIIGVRSYNTDEWLKYKNSELLEYVRNGGTMVVQYNTNSNLVMEQIGPYPFKISRDRVTEENAAVTFLKPDHPVLNVPNKITQKDFEGWIQERGLYFVNEVAPDYDRILAMNDTGEKPMDGALIVSNYGKGRYVYTGLSFFRELPAGVPGAIRLFVNLISTPNQN